MSVFDDMYSDYVARQQAEGLPVLSRNALADRLLTAMIRSQYLVEIDAAQHTCWDSPAWDGMLSPDTCAGCAQAVAHPCHYCGYGHIFTTHNAEAHYEHGDPMVADDKGREIEMSAEWTNHPHIYRTSL